MPLMLVFALGHDRLAAATATISETVTMPAADINPIGLHGRGDSGATKYSNGNLIGNSGFEPITMRNLYRVLTAGKDEQGRRYITLDGPGTSFYQLLTSGTYSGTPFRAYRMLDAQGQTLPTRDFDAKKGLKIIDTASADQIRSLGALSILPKSTELPGGGWQAPGQEDYQAWAKQTPAYHDEMIKLMRVYYAGDADLMMDDIVIFAKTAVMIDPADVHARCSDSLRDHFAKTVQPADPDGTVVAEVTQVAHSGTLPPDMDGGRSCLRIALKSPGRAIYQQNVVFGPIQPTGKLSGDQLWYGQLEPGVTYQYGCWLRAEGFAADSQVEFSFKGGKEETYFGTKIAKAFTVDGTWKRYGFTFTAPPRPTSGKLTAPIIAITGPGTLYLDNFTLMPVYAPGDEQKDFVVNQTMLKNLIATQPDSGRKGSLRSWAALADADMASVVTFAGGQQVGFGGLLGIGRPEDTVPRALTICAATGADAEQRMVPWLNLQITYSEEEMQGFIEYLVAPFDPAKDDAKSKPYGYQRYQQRGHGRPWLDDFREIVVEFGNENWHNRFNKSWIGVGRYKAIWSAGKDYGLFCRYLIEQIQRSPYWTPDVAKKISFAVTGGYGDALDKDGKPRGFGAEASAACRIQRYETHANYVGPKWETNDKMENTLGDAAFQRYLVAGQQINGTLDAYGQALAVLQKQGMAVRIAGYEGGPSGFAIDNRDINHPSEILGHSQASGVAMSDAWLSSWAHGWAYQTYLSYGTGMKWSSHVPLGAGFRPAPAFQAMTMLNHLMTGDMLEVKSDSPAVAIPASDKKGKTPDQTVPVLGIYARKNGHQLSVAVVNRSLDQDLPLTITVPYAAVAGITRHWLDGKATATNREELLVTPKQEAVATSAFTKGALTVQAPAASLQIFVLQLAQ